MTFDTTLHLLPQNI